MGYTIKSIKKSSLLIFLVISSGFMFVPVSKSKSVDYFFTIKGIYADYFETSEFASQYKNQLEKIGINLELEGLNIFEYIDQKHYIHDYDLLFGLTDQNGFVDDVNTSVGYDITLDYDSLLGTGENQWYLDTFDAMFPIYTRERREFFYEWQDYLMDEIVPITPLLAMSTKSAYWDNLLGYNSTYGLIQSVGNIQFDSLHSGQQNTSELILGASFGSGINPIKYYGTYLEYPLQAVFDPLVWKDNYRNYWPHIATDWVHINNTHVRFTIRDNIKWKNDPDGLFPSEFLDTADIYFSYFCHKNISSDRRYYENMKDFKIINETTIDIYFDGDIDTPENEIYPNYLDLLSKLSIVPEHYLNQTQLLDGVTPDDTHPSWLNFSNNCFGTGPYYVSSYVDDDHRNYTLFEDSWRLDPDLLLDSTLNWEIRFGNTWAIKKLCILDMAPIQSQINNLLAGTVDLIEDLPSDNFFEQIPRDSSFELDAFSYRGGMDILFNLREERTIIGNRDPCPNNENISKGLAVRKAISYATDVESLNRDTFDGYYTRDFYPISIGMGIWCSPTIIKYTYNLGEATYYMGLLGYDVDDFNATTEIIGLPFFVTFIGMQGIFVIFLYSKQKKK